MRQPNRQPEKQVMGRRDCELTDTANTDRLFDRGVLNTLRCRRNDISVVSDDFSREPSGQVTGEDQTTFKSMRFDGTDEK